jgi:hypothetical protein
MRGEVRRQVQGNLFHLSGTVPLHGLCSHTENAVKTQIWVAISICVLVAIVKMPILQTFSATDYENDAPDDDNQLILQV